MVDTWAESRKSYVVFETENETTSGAAHEGADFWLRLKLDLYSVEGQNWRTMRVRHCVESQTRLVAASLLSRARALNFQYKVTLAASPALVASRAIPAHKCQESTCVE